MNSQIDSVNVKRDTSVVEPIRFSDPLSDTYSGSEFEYDTVEGETQNLLARIISWFFKGIQNIFGIEIPLGVQQLLKNLIYILLLITATYFIIRLLAGKEAVSFFRNKNKLVAPVAIQEENIENVDLDKRIADALTDKNYRLAIRFKYLKILKELSLRNLIHYHFEKTNSEYTKEIVNDTLKAQFIRISYLYEYIWYGEFDLDQLGYERAKNSFDHLEKIMDQRG